MGQSSIIIVVPGNARRVEVRHAGGGGGRDGGGRGSVVGPSAAGKEGHECVLASSFSSSESALTLQTMRYLSVSVRL